MGAAQSGATSSNNDRQSIVQKLRKRIKRAYCRYIKKNKNQCENIQIQIVSEDLPRCSTFSSTCCYLCQHRDVRKCCRYSNDSKSDAKKYGKWKTVFEFPSKPIKPIRIIGLSDAVAVTKKPKKSFSFKPHKKSGFERSSTPGTKKTAPSASRPVRRRSRARACANGIIIV